MLRLNRTTEYGLVALRHMSQRPDELLSAREIAQEYGFPFEILAKTLQRLNRIGVVESVQGAHGGYRIKLELSSMDLAQFIRLMEDSPGVVACIAPEHQCEFEERCEIKGPLRSLNDKFYRFLATIRLDEVVGELAVDQLEIARERQTALATAQEP